jgi:hypothetical protein
MGKQRSRNQPCPRAHRHRSQSFGLPGRFTVPTSPSNTSNVSVTTDATGAGRLHITAIGTGSDRTSATPRSNQDRAKRDDLQSDGRTVRVPRAMPAGRHVAGAWLMPGTCRRRPLTSGEIDMLEGRVRTPVTRPAYHRHVAGHAQSLVKTFQQSGLRRGLHDDRLAHVQLQVGSIDFAGHADRTSTVSRITAALAAGPWPPAGR